MTTGIAVSMNPNESFDNVFHYFVFICSMKTRQGDRSCKMGVVARRKKIVAKKKGGSGWVGGA